MKCITFKVKTIDKSFEIIPLSDVHIGSTEFASKEFEETIKYILEKKNRYCIINGDLIDNATKSSPSDIFSQKLTPTQQIKKAAKYLEPIKDRIISITTGNHELRSWKDCGLDMTLMLCSELGIEDRYSSVACMDFIVADGIYRSKKNEKRNFNSNYLFTLYHTHGAGGSGKKVGSRANKVEAIGEMVADCDCVVHSHTHQPIAFKEDYLMTDRAHKKVQQKTKLFVNTNSFLNFGESSYGERLGFKPSTVEVPRIQVHFKNSHKGSDIEMRAII